MRISRTTPKESKSKGTLRASRRARKNARRRKKRRAERDSLVLLTSRAQQNEALLSREQERLHELRATLAGVVHAHRLLTDDRAVLSRSIRQRLQRLLGAELARTERLLADDRRQPASPVELGAVLDPLVDAIRLRGHAVLWNGTRCRAMGPPDHIAEIAHILLDNAARHAGGRRISLDVTDGNGWIELHVSDDGTGVPPHLAQVLFERGTRSSTSRGQGIGLNIARRLAHELGGDLWLEAGPAASGASFILQLPDSTGASRCLAAAV